MLPPASQRDPLQREHGLRILVCGEHGNQVVGLEDESDPISTQMPPLPTPKTTQIAPVNADRPARGAVQRADQIER